jgi:hypothetical protein
MKRHPEHAGRAVYFERLLIISGAQRGEPACGDELPR